MYCFGKGTYGAMGTGNEVHAPYTHPIENRFFANNKLGIKNLALGEWHTVALTNGGDVYTCGYGGESGFSLTKLIRSPAGALGHGNSDHQLLPRRVEYFVQNKLKIKQIAAGRYHSVALTEGGEVYTWGKSAYGTLGLGRCRPKVLPVHLANLCGLKQKTDADTIVKIDAADAFTAVLTSIQLQQ